MVVGTVTRRDRASRIHVRSAAESGQARTDVITSIAFVIGLALVIVLGLAANTHFRKAAFAGRLRSFVLPIMNDATLRQIAAAKVTDTIRSHVWISDHI